MWESEAAQYNMINIIEVMQMVRRRGALWRETILNGYFCSNYALICVDGRCGVDAFPPDSGPNLIGDSRGEETFCAPTTKKKTKKTTSGSREEKERREKIPHQNL